MHRFADQPSKRSGNRVLRASVIALVLLAGCGTERTPNSYTDSVGKNFVTSCVAQSKDGISNSEKVCTCTYDTMKKTVKFSRFKEINSQLTKEPGPLPADVTRIIDNCKSGTTTTESTSTTAGTG